MPLAEGSSSSTPVWLLLLVVVGALVAVTVVYVRLRAKRQPRSIAPIRPSVPAAEVPPAPAVADPAAPDRAGDAWPPAAASTDPAPAGAWTPAPTPAAPGPAGGPVPQVAAVAEPRPVAAARPAGGAARLGIDFGTSNTVAVLRTADGRRLPVLFDGAPLLPSAVFAAEDGTFAVGRDALHLARTSPDRFEPSPKRCIDDQTVLLGGVGHPVVDLIAAVLTRVVAESRRILDGATPAATLTHPAAWGPRRRELLVAAAVRAGLTSLTLVAEPVAAAGYLTGVHPVDVPAGGTVLVYDFGGGTFDATVLTRTSDGFAVTATEGLPDAGGLDVDAALVAHIGATYAALDPQRWQRLQHPADAGDRRARWTLWEDIRTAKEMLSRSSSTSVHVPLYDRDTVLTRDQFEVLARPVIDRTVTAARAAQAAAGGAPSAILLVGGSSRIPLAATVLHRVTGVAPTTLEQPETAVAEGAALHTG